MCATYLSAGATFPITHNNNVFAQETRPQKELYQVTVTNLTKNKNEMITKFDILNAVQTTALGKVPITKSILKEYEQNSLSLFKKMVIIVSLSKLNIKMEVLQKSLFQW